MNAALGLCAALCILFNTAGPEAEAGVGGALSMTPWMDAETGRTERLFDRDGSGSLDGRSFFWKTEHFDISLYFLPNASVGSTVHMELCRVGDGMALCSDSAVFIHGDAADLDEEAAALGEEIAEFARSLEGFDYHYGGKSPDTGFDCSGLVYYCFGRFGYQLDRMAADQAKCGEHVDREDIRAGDIICFKTGSYFYHVGVYLGQGMMVHAECAATGVVVGDFTGYYENRGYEIRRIAGVMERSVSQ